MISVLAVTALLMMSLVPVAWAQTSPWPMFRHDQKHTGRTNFTGPATPALYWAFPANDAITASPSIGHNGTIYVGAGGYYQGGGDSALYAINPDGSLKWLFKADSGSAPGQAAGIFSSVAVADDGTLYVGSLDGYMYALEDSVTYAKLRWRTNPGDWPFYASPIVGDGGIVYAGCLNFRFYAFNPDGQLRWFYPTGWCVFSSAIIDEADNIYFGSKDHNLWCFRDAIPFGDLQWSLPVGTFYDGHLIDCSPAMGDDGTIYFGADPYGAAGQTPVEVDTVFFAANPNGTLKWKFVMGDGVESSPAIGHDGTIYVGSYDSCLYAIEDRGTYGLLKWKFPTGGPVDASPTVDGDGTIYIGSRDSVLYALNPEDGSVKWSFPTQGGIESSVTIDGNGYLYFGSFDHNLYCLGTGAPDVGAASIDLPSTVQINTQYTPTVSVAGYRVYSQNANAVCVITQGATEIYRDTITITNIPGGGTKQGFFEPWSVADDEGIVYAVAVHTILAGDLNLGNDSLVIQVTSVPEIQWVCADINASGSGPDISDLVYLVSYMFQGGPAPLFPQATDVNGSGFGPDIADLVYLVTYMFQSGPAPNCG
jgi:outer membrane protein assembly factor BamB